jgi:hypothetical protein
MTEHKVEANWRHADAASLEVRALAIEQALEHIEDLTVMFENDEDVTKELRGITGRLRERKNDLSQKAETIRAELADGS